VGEHLENQVLYLDVQLLRYFHSPASLPAHKPKSREKKQNMPAKASLIFYLVDTLNQIDNFEPMVVRPTYSIPQVKALVLAGKVVITRAAQESALADFDFGEKEIIDTVLALTMRNFYKTMDSELKAGLMQDVYHRQIGDKMAYIKLQINEGVVIISFKRK
jgi:motility quorum-sensing regulator / GCU-specific mRNA interferase toxin